MAKYIYVIEISEVENSGMNGNVYQREYCKSAKDANLYIDGIIAINKGFDVQEVILSKLAEAEGYIRSLYYKWDNHRQGQSNLHQPQRDVLTSIEVRKVRLKYT